MPPRAQFTMRTPFFILANARRASIRPRVSVGERRVDGDEVGAREELVERHQLDADRAPRSRREMNGS